jgi:hypothetical protein
VGHLTFVGLISLSLVMTSQTKETSDSMWSMNIPMLMGSFEIACKELAITVRDSCEFHTHAKMWATLIGTEDC